MSASNYNWVCFSCRYHTRAAKTSNKIPKCQECNRECFCLGYKVEIPKKNDTRSWKKLRIDCQKRHSKNQENMEVYLVKRKHELEKEIIRLEPRSENKDIKRLIKKLKDELESLR